jgi:catechol 2,3-dioxygenase-like lactoylglutathione lyase family enzyme
MFVNPAISGLSYVRLSAPDLGRMEAFLQDFGMQKVHRDERTLYMRGIGSSPCLHVTELGEPGVISFAYDLQDAAQLADLARAPGAQGIETVDAPGGGRRVRVQEPNGLWLEFLAGREQVAPLPERSLLRGADGISRSQGPARVKRISHTAYKSPDPQRTIAWFRSTLGLLPTDELYVETPDNLLGQFLRLDQGDAPVDHHVVFLLKGQRGLHHISYEVESVDDIFFGKDWLEAQGHDHVRGIGRHALGSQIFDYWMGPFGQMHEHWISSEKMNRHSRFNSIRIGDGMAHDSGEKPPERFVRQSTPIVPWPAQSETR